MLHGEYRQTRLPDKPYERAAMSNSPVVDNRADVGDAELSEISDGVFAYVQPDGTWWINNTGFVVAEDRVVAIDSCATEKRSRRLLSTIDHVTKKPVKTLINTHHHGDHTHGNFVFRDATVIAHDACRKALITEGLPHTAPVAGSGAWGEPEWGTVHLAPPFVTFTDSVNVYADDLLCEVRHLGMPAHTTNDAVVWIPERKVLFAGDLLFNGGTPFLLAGSLRGALAVVGRLKQFDAEVIVPGHGPVGGPEIIDEVLDYLRFVQEVAQRAHAAGLTPLQAAREAELGRFAALSDSERLVGNLHRAYSELDGGPMGASLDVRAALHDMVTFNGGRPLTCLA
ncbi:MBL fold metallo-hydrolase [Streptomyces sp. NPDC059474]|uniref:MBL fold metallo-hydrolase n=1 Tax=Streptomyces sp. NPDC059474 TaxID=3346846 RepID=UPI0036824EA3